MNLREKICVWPLAIITVVLGLYPALYLDMVGPSMNLLAHQVGMPWLAP
jgi:NADH:ubiquinone oxidoreductase subunit 4 (subunit M)